MSANVTQKRIQNPPAAFGTTLVDVILLVSPATKIVFYVESVSYANLKTEAGVGSANRRDSDIVGAGEV